MEIVCVEEITLAGNGTDIGVGVGAVKAYGKGGGITPFILNFGCTWRLWSVSRHGLFYPRKEFCYRFSRRLSPQVRSGSFGGEESLLPLPEFKPLII
jgi:hypothetical protein